jgi:serine/threonine-protein kinase
MALSAGLQLGPYTILAPIGAGGMGEVYRARDARLEREVAVKVLPAQLSCKEEALARFEREAKVLAALSHPAILAVYDVGRSEETRYVVMELLEGETLKARLDRGPLPWRVALELALPILDGLAAAHSRGVVHRDLKPENIFLTRDGVVKILDFGLAALDRDPDQDPTQDRTRSALTGPHAVVGTVRYMAPELLRHRPADPRSDLFALGCLLHEMVAGRPPFGRDTIAETIAAILKDDPPPLPALDGEPPALLEQVVARCLAKDPDQRFGSALELRTALRALLQPGELALSPSSGSARPRGQRTKRIDSIAVLPLANSSADPEADYLGDGITESLINALSQIPKLKVMGQELGVRAVLTGELTQRDDQLTVRVELVDADDGARLWGDRLERRLADLVGLPDDIARQISAQLHQRLVRRRPRAAARRPDSETYRLYLKGRWFWNRRDQAGLRQAIELFQQAIATDPGFAPAYSGLADAYSLLGGFGLMSPREAYAQARARAREALALDEGLAEAHNSLALVLYRHDWEFAAAEREFRRAIELNPGYTTARFWFGVCLALMGRFEPAFVEVGRALELDPLSPVIHWTRAYLLYYARRFDEAAAQCYRVLEVDPSFQRVRFDLGLICFQQGKYDAGLEQIRLGLQSVESSSKLEATLGYALAICGNLDGARAILDRLRSDRNTRHVSAYSLALIHLALGEYEPALDLLEGALQEHDDALVTLKVNPRFDPLRGHPRFADLQRRVGLPLH